MSCWRQVTLPVGWPVSVRVVSQGVGKAAGVQYLGKLSGSLIRPQVVFQFGPAGRFQCAGHGERVNRNEVRVLEVRGCGPYMQQAGDGCDVREERVHRGVREKTPKSWCILVSEWPVANRYEKIRAEERNRQLSGNLFPCLA